MNVHDLNNGDVVLLSAEGPEGKFVRQQVMVIWTPETDDERLSVVDVYGVRHQILLDSIKKVVYVEMNDGEELSVE